MGADFKTSRPPDNGMGAKPGGIDRGAAGGADGGGEDCSPGGEDGRPQTADSKKTAKSARKAGDEMAGLAGKVAAGTATKTEKARLRVLLGG